MNISGFIKRDQLTSFFLLAFVGGFSLSMVLYATLQITGSPPLVTQAPPLALMILFLAQASASTAGIVMTLVVGGREGMRDLVTRLKQWRVGINWWAAAILTTLVAATPVFITLATTISVDFLPAIFKGQGLAVIPFALFFGLMAGLLEEFGWTGFALPRLLDRNRAFLGALKLGIIWSLWHAPLIVWIWPAVPSANPMVQIIGGLVWMAALVPYRVLMSWVYINTNSSLLVGGIIMHAFYNGSLATLVPATLSPAEILAFYTGLTVVLGVFVLAVVVVFGARTMARA